MLNFNIVSNVFALALVTGIGIGFATSWDQVEMLLNRFVGTTSSSWFAFGTVGIMFAVFTSQLFMLGVTTKFNVPFVTQLYLNEICQMFDIDIYAESEYVDDEEVETWLSEDVKESFTYVEGEDEIQGQSSELEAKAIVEPGTTDEREDEPGRSSRREKTAEKISLKDTEWIKTRSGREIVKESRRETYEEETVDISMDEKTAKGDPFPESLDETTLIENPRLAPAPSGKEVFPEPADLGEVKDSLMKQEEESIIVNRTKEHDDTTFELQHMKSPDESQGFLYQDLKKLKDGQPEPIAEEMQRYEEGTVVITGGEEEAASTLKGDSLEMKDTEESQPFPVSKKKKDEQMAPESVIKDNLKLGMDKDGKMVKENRTPQGVVKEEGINNADAGIIEGTDRSNGLYEKSVLHEGSKYGSEQLEPIANEALNLKQEKGRVASGKHKENVTHEGLVEKKESDNVSADMEGTDRSDRELVLHRGSKYGYEQPHLIAEERVKLNQEIGRVVTVRKNGGLKGDRPLEEDLSSENKNQQQYEEVISYEVEHSPQATVAKEKLRSGQGEEGTLYHQRPRKFGDDPHEPVTEEITYEVVIGKDDGTYGADETLTEEEPPERRLSPKTMGRNVKVLTEITKQLPKVKSFGLGQDGKWSVTNSG